MHIKFGVMLNAFLVALDPGWVLQSSTIKEGYIFQGQTPGKLKFDIIPSMWFFPGNIIKPVIYIVLWLAKLALYPYLQDLKSYKA
jgi:hypothetical protein